MGCQERMDFLLPLPINLIMVENSELLQWEPGGIFKMIEVPNTPGMNILSGGIFLF